MSVSLVPRTRARLTRPDVAVTCRAGESDDCQMDGPFVSMRPRVPRLVRGGPGEPSACKQYVPEFTCSSPGRRVQAAPGQAAGKPVQLPVTSAPEPGRRAGRGPWSARPG